MASHGLATTAGSGSTGRRPGLELAGEAVVQALELGLAAPPTDRDRKTAASSAIEASRTSGFSILLNQPMKRVSAARGMRLVSRKLRSSCWVKRGDQAFDCHESVSWQWLALVAWIRHFRFFSLSAAAVAGAAAAAFPKLQGAARAVARQAPLADRTFQDVAPGRAAGAVLRIRHRRLLPLPTARRRTSRPQRQDGFFRLAGLYAAALRQGPRR